MERIIINTRDSASEILVGADWESAGEMIPAEGSVIITDDNMLRLYGEKFPDHPVLSVRPGEDSKKLRVIGQLAERLLDEGVDRNGFILGIGGGVVCDIAGFLASVYLRGVRCGYVSSSLLSQVDASTGGKNGVNLGGTKNIIGIIRQPEFVICDTRMLMTLPGEEYLSGLAELIKTAIIGDRELFEMIESNHTLIMKRDNDLLVDLVGRSVKFKAAVVTEDERETGLRRVLNFGHTFGHAIEMQTKVRHGFAVAAGMVLATEFSAERGFIGQDVRKRILGLLHSFGYESYYGITHKRIENLVRHDKKKSGSSLHFVFTAGIGKALIEKIPIGEVIDFYKRFIDKK